MSASTASAQPDPGLPIWARLLAAPIVVAVLLAGLWLFAGQLAPWHANGSIAFAVGWFVIAYLRLRVLFRRFPELGLPVQATFAVVAIAVGFWYAWNTFRDVTVNEQIAVGVVASEITTSPPATAPPAPAGATDAPSEPAPEDAMTEDSSAPAAGAAEEGAPPPADESDAIAAANVQLSSGEFFSLAHGTTGTAAVVELAEGSRVLTFTDLDGDNGPDLRVYLVEGPVNGNGDGADFVDLGDLKGNKGNQQYEIGTNVGLDRFDTVVIWCRAFSVGFGAATLMPS